MNNDLELARIIKIKFGTDPNSPTSHQLEKIKKDIQSLVSNGITPSEKDWLKLSRNTAKVQELIYTKVQTTLILSL
ncbi:hypothetical protein [Klebsiella michiganensis]|uniref:hypothetical protein n=1 Tax=Klebsiella michiganensis TaxID=1134687 RepID=UPI001CCCBE9B|nr:hypothetical protein [Klebsiella michiganensis]